MSRVAYFFGITLQVYYTNLNNASVVLSNSNLGRCAKHVSIARNYRRASQYVFWLRVSP